VRVFEFEDDPEATHSLASAAEARTVP